MQNNYFEQKQQRINDFVVQSNPILGNNPLFYPGHFITGQLNNPHILFVSINPGHSNRENWDDVAARRAQTKIIEFKPQPIKYIADAKRGSRYANRILDIVCGGKLEQLEHCAETNFVSYFAAPKEDVLLQQLQLLPDELRIEHDALTKLDINEINPKHIVCIGWRSFDRFIKHYGEGNEVVSHSLPLLDQLEAYYAHTYISGIEVHGVRHLCTKLTLDMRHNLEAKFSRVWKQSV